jgi:hypothetical protein
MEIHESRMPFRTATTPSVDEEYIRISRRASQINPVRFRKTKLFPALPFAAS